MLWLQIAIISGFILIHLFAGKLKSLDVIPRSRWLSAGGGVSVAYVFVHVFPELADAQRHIEDTVRIFGSLERHAYVVALGGLILFYALERLVKAEHAGMDVESRKPYGGSATGSGIFWIHIGTFALYNLLIGYLMSERRSASLQELLLYAFAMGVHFLVNDYGLRQIHRNHYLHSGRWLLAAAVLLGWLVGLLHEVSRALTATMSAFLAGGVVMNVLKEELPEDRESRLLPFVLAATGYGTLLLLM